jgi:hypothetical protein
MQGEIEHFVSAVLNGQQPRTHGREGIKSMQVILAAEAAEREGRVINVSEFINRPENKKPWNKEEFMLSVKKKYGRRLEKIKSWDEFRSEAKEKYSWYPAETDKKQQCYPSS